MYNLSDDKYNVDPRRALPPKATFRELIKNYLNMNKYNIMNKILLIDIAFTTMTFINLLLYLITGENQNTLYFGLCVTSILLMMLWFAIRCMKFRNQKNESHWLLTLLTISNVM